MKRVLVILAGLVLVLAGCGSSTKSATSHNDADVSFVNGMIPHHEQAVEMSKLAPTRAQSPKIKELATRIQGAQDPEIAQMKGYLASWGVKAAADGGHGMDMGGSMGGAGMMSADQMRSLEAATGAEFDKRYAEQMVEHHRGAVMMAKDEVAKGKSGEAIALAKKIISAQEGEISELGAVLATL